MRSLLLLPLLLLLAACGSATAPADTAAPSVAEENEAAAPQEDVQESPQSGDSIQDGKSSVVTGTTPQEASIVRAEDHFIGAEDPVVTIIEYGDFQ